MAEGQRQLLKVVLATEIRSIELNPDGSISVEPAPEGVLRHLQDQERARSPAVVAGTGFEPVTFGL